MGIIASIKRKAPLKGRNFNLQSDISNAHRSMKMGIKNLKIIGNSNYKIVKHENMVTDTEKVAQEICTFLGLQFDKSMLIPTVNGQPAVANTAYKNLNFKPGEVSQYTKDIWLKELSNSEIIFISTLMSKISRPLNYAIKEYSLVSYMLSALKINKRYRNKYELININLKKALHDWLSLKFKDADY